MGEFDGLGRALRYLRTERNLLQKDVAERAGKTKALVSAYETEKTLPTFETVGQILDAMGADRFDLLNALEEVNGRATRDLSAIGEGKRKPQSEVLAALGIEQVSAEEAEVFLRMLDAFLAWFHLIRLQRPADQSPPPLATPHPPNLSSAVAFTATK
ncbi:MAG: helix-turn-helix transcriptional regulator [Acidobacteriota bacterium]